jgi:hypothetical protein
MEARNEMDYSMRGIQPQDVEVLWRFAEPYVKRSLDHAYGEVIPEDLKQMCLKAQAQLWMIMKGNRVAGAGTTQIVLHPQMKVCRIITLSGDEFPEWMDFAHMNLEMWAVNQGCVGMEAFVRRGFVPKLREIGYGHRTSVVYKTL